MATFLGDATLAAVTLATMLPFVAFILIMLWARSRPMLSAGLSIGAVSVSLGCALSLLIGNWGMQEPVQYAARWLVSGSVSVPFGFLIDPLSLLMLAIVAVIAFLVQVYSLGYMAGDTGFSRYYAFMSLFAWAMMSLTVSLTVLQLYIFWELVGLSSYLLIGFWVERFSATQAGKKAFVMTRAGDVAFFIGLLIVMLHLGNLNILEVNGPQVAAGMSPAILTLSALLIFGGIVGKSAQFPLLTWLPDAMEGPTPVSALLHSATMVAAGVFLFARLFPFFSLSPSAMSVFLVIGTISMLIASTMAMVSRDIKQVWAYSTISQLGFMIMALGAGGYFAGVFHLTTHAAFKALLFLCSGVFIHAFHTNDIFEFARKGCTRLKIPSLCLLVATAALAGLPPLSGFFSKEAILGGMAELRNPIWLAAALLGVFLTAYYSFRVIFVIFTAKPKPAGYEGDSEVHAASHEDDGHHASYWPMAWPLVVLAALTVVLGFLQNPLQHFVEPDSVAAHAHGDGHPVWLAVLSVGLALAGVVVAFVEFGRRGARQVGFVERVPILHNLFAERWYLDHFYRKVLDRLVDRGLATLFYKNDNQVIDGGIELMSQGTVESGRVFSVLHTVMVQYRLLTLFAVVALLALYFFL